MEGHSLSNGAARLLNRAYHNPWLLLTLTCLFWGGNVVAAREAIGEISPMALVAGRWAICCSILLFVARRDFLRDLPVLNPHWPRLALMGFFGFAAYHALYYVSAYYTSGLHISILQGVSPVIVFIGAWALWGLRATVWQVVGCALTLIGAALVGAQGDLRQLAGVSFNLGDAGMILASVFYACYSLSLRSRPRASPFGFFAALAIVALATSVPLFVGEVAMGQAVWPSLKGGIILLYVAIFPTLLAQMFFIRGVELIGPSRATLFYNLTPALGAIFSTVFLGEHFEAYHAIALCLVIGGVLMAEKLGRKPA